METSLGFAPLLSLHRRTGGSHCLEGFLHLQACQLFLISTPGALIRVCADCSKIGNPAPHLPLAMHRLAGTFHPWPLSALMDCQRGAARFVACKVWLLPAIGRAGCADRTWRPFSPPLGRLPMRNGKGGLVRHKTRCWVSRKQTKQNGPFATKHGHSLETSWREFVPEQPSVLDVDISQPIAPYVGIHDSSPRSPPSSSLTKCPRLLDRGSEPDYPRRCWPSCWPATTEVRPAPHGARHGGPAHVKSSTSDFGGHRFRRPGWLLRASAAAHRNI